MKAIALAAVLLISANAFATKTCLDKGLDIHNSAKAIGKLEAARKNTVESAPAAAVEIQKVIEVKEHELRLEIAGTLDLCMKTFGGDDIAKCEKAMTEYAKVSKSNARAQALNERVDFAAEIRSGIHVLTGNGCGR